MSDFVKENLDKQKEIRDKIFEHKNAIKSLRSDLYDLIMELQVFNLTEIQKLSKNT